MATEPAEPLEARREDRKKELKCDWASNRILFGGVCKKRSEWFLGGTGVVFRALRWIRREQEQDGG